MFYAFTGFFGAALYGAGTQGNVMLNDLAGSSTSGCIVLYGAMLLYLAAGAAACQYPLRTSLDHMLVGEHVPMTRARSVSHEAAAQHLKHGHVMWGVGHAKGCLLCGFDT